MDKMKEEKNKKNSRVRREGPSTQPAPSDGGVTRAALGNNEFN